MSKRYILLDLTLETVQVGHPRVPYVWRGDFNLDKAPTMEHLKTGKDHHEDQVHVSR